MKPQSTPQRSRAGLSLLAVPTLLVLLVPAAAAQDVPLAQKSLKAAAKQAVAEMGPDLKFAVADAKAALASFDTEVAHGNYDLGLAFQLGDGLTTFMAAVAREMEQAQSHLLDGCEAGLAAGGPGWNGWLPTGFLPGDASTLDDTMAAIVKKGAAAVAQVSRRLESTAKKLEQKEGVTLLFRMTPPPLPQSAATEDWTGGWVAPVGIDLVLSIQGLLLVAGHAEPGSFVTVEAYAITGAIPALTQITGLDPDFATARYSTWMIDDSQPGPFQPGIYNLIATQSFGTGLAQIGVR